MIYVIKLSSDDDYNVLAIPVAVPYLMKGYVPWDAIKYNDNVIDVTEMVSKEVKSSWIGASMFDWSAPVAKEAHEFVKGLKEAA